MPSLSVQILLSGSARKSQVRFSQLWLPLLLSSTKTRNSEWDKVPWQLDTMQNSLYCEERIQVKGKPYKFVPCMTRHFTYMYTHHAHFEVLQRVKNWKVLLHITEKDISNFVDLAHTTLGEDDLAQQKIRYLRNALTGYTPLLYEFDEQSLNFDQFMEKCQRIWTTMDKNKDLPDNLVSRY